MQMNSGERLKEERERLGLTQVEMGAAGGVKKLAQGNYENNSRSPDSEYLARIAEAGADIQYIVTGIRSDNAPGNGIQHRYTGKVKQAYEDLGDAIRLLIGK